MSRHNEGQKMELRIRAEEEKRESAAEKGERERAEMEQKSQTKFTVHFIEWFNPKRHQGFIVNLRQPLTEEEIAMRMLKGFGDL